MVGADQIYFRWLNHRCYLHEGIGIVHNLTHQDPILLGKSPNPLFNYFLPYSYFIFFFFSWRCDFLDYLRTYIFLQVLVYCAVRTYVWHCWQGRQQCFDMGSSDQMPRDALPQCNMETTKCHLYVGSTPKISFSREGYIHIFSVVHHQWIQNSTNLSTYHKR